MSAVVMARIADLATAPIEGATWRERLEEVMTRRFSAYEQVMAYRRAAQAHAHHSTVVQSNNETMRQHLRKTLAGLVPAHVRADRAAFEALDMVLSIDAWIRLRIEQRLEPARARAAVRRTVSALVGPEG